MVSDKSKFLSFIAIMLFSCIVMFGLSSTSHAGVATDLQVFKTGVQPDCDFTSLGGLFGITDELQNCTKDEDVFAGEEFFVLVQVRNFDTEDADDVIVIDDFPFGWTLLEVSGTQFSSDPAEPDLPITCAPTDSSVCEDTGGDDPEASCIRCQIGDLNNAVIPGIIPEINSFLLKFQVNSNHVVGFSNGVTAVLNTAYTGLEGGAILDQYTDSTIVQDDADLEITKVCNHDLPLDSGDTVQCTAIIKNNGTSWSRDVILRDTITFAPGSSIAPFSIGPFSENQDVNGFNRFCTFVQNNPNTSPFVFECELGVLPNEDQVTVSYTFTANQGTNVTDVVQAICHTQTTEGTPDPDCSNNMATDEVLFENSADLSIQKLSSAAGGPVGPGDSILYTLTISNNGPGSANNVRVVDILPDHVEINGLILAPLGSVCFQEIINKKIVCDIGGVLNPFAPGDGPAVITIPVEVQAGASGSLQNIAMVSSDTADPITSNNTSVTNDAVQAVVADLKISKEVFPDPTVAGEVQTAIITVTNNGPDDVTSVQIRDIFPQALIPIEPLPSGCTLAGSGDIECNLTGIPAGFSRIIEILFLIPSDYLINDPNNDGFASCSDGVSIQMINNMPDEDVDPITFNNTAFASTFCVDESDLKITKVCKPDEPLFAGDTGFCDIFVDNLGPSDARDVLMTDEILSEGLFDITDVTVIQSCTDCTVTCDPTSASMVMEETVVCDLGDLTAIQSDNRTAIRISVQANEDVDINNVATVNSLTPDPYLPNNMAEGSINVDGIADMRVQKSCPDTVVAGGPAFDYLIDIGNWGPSQAVNVVVEDVVPAGLSINSVVGSGGAQCETGVPGVATLPTVCNYDSVNDNDAFTQTMTINVSVPPDLTGILHNDVMVSSDTFDDFNINNIDTCDTTITQSADLVVTKVVTTPASGPVSAGDPLGWTVTITNNGPSSATGISLTDILPPEVTFDSANILLGTGACQFFPPPPDAIVECNFTDVVDPGESVIVAILSTVNNDVPNGTDIENCVSATSDAFDPDEVNNTDICANIDSAVSADLWMEKDSNFPTGNPSGTVQYFCTVHNDEGCSELPHDATGSNVCGTGGPSNAENVVIRDYLPLNPKKVIFQFASQGCFYNQSGHYVQCEADLIQHGDAVTYEIQVDFKGSVKEDIINRCEIISSDTPDPDGSNNEHHLRTVVQGGTGDPGGPGGGRGRGGNNGRTK